MKEVKNRGNLISSVPQYTETCTAFQGPEWYIMLHW